MKNIFSIIIIFFSCFHILSAQQQFEAGMKKAFELWSSGESQEAANLFERIANAEGDNWLPYYYTAQIKIIESFEMKDLAKKEKTLEMAQNQLNMAKSLSGQENVEIMILQAMLHTSYITLDPSVYGMKLSGKVSSIYKKTLEIAPENPRVVLSNAEWEMGSARFFGEDPKKYCTDIERSLELFSKFKNEGAFYPSWGEDRAKMILQNNCKDQ